MNLNQQAKSVREVTESICPIAFEITLYVVMQKEDMPIKLQEQFAAFQQFNTSRFFGQQADPIAACTAEKYADHAR